MSLAICAKRLGKVCLAFTFFLLSLHSNAQNAIVGSGFSSGWGGACGSNANFTYFSAGAGTSYGSAALTPAGTSTQYWRIGVDWSGTIKQVHLNTSGTDVGVSPNTTYTLNSTCVTSGAMFYNVSSTTNRYIFKTRDASATPSYNFVFFELSSAPVTVSSVKQTPLAANVQPGQAVTITGTLSAALPTGQAAWLRYTTDNFTTSTCVKMTGSGTSYTASIPSTANTSAASVKYYVFTSGTQASVAHADADLYTINQNNNGGSNYSYVVATASAIYLHNFNDGPTTIPYTTSPTATTGTPTGVFNSNLSSSSWSTTAAAFTNSAGQSGQSLSIAGFNTGVTQTLTGSFNIASGYQLSVSSFDFWTARSATGPTNWAMTINGTTVGSGILSGTTGVTLGQTNVSNAVSNITGSATVVITLSGGSNSLGTLKLDNFTLNGTVSAIPVPTLTTPTTASITASGATLGATLTALNDASVSQYGTIYSTSNPTTFTTTSGNNPSTLGSYSSGAPYVFTDARTGLSAQTQYYYTGYAINYAGTGFGTTGSFRTLSNSPTSQASGLTVGNPSVSTLDLSLSTDAIFPGSGATTKGYLIFRSTGTVNYTCTPGAAPLAGSGTTLIVTTTATTLGTYTDNGLSASTTYNYVIVPYTYDGTNAATYNYLTSSPATASGITSATASTPVVSSISVSAPGSGTSGYVGSTVTITGSNFAGATSVTVGGTSVSYIVTNATTITFTANNSSGQVVVTSSGGSSTDAVTYTNLGYISTASTDWNTTSTWLGNALPPAGSTVTIANAVTVSGAVSSSPSSLTINNGSSLTFNNASGALTTTAVTNNGTLAFSAAGTLTIASGGTLANGTNTFTASTGTVVFAGTGTVTGTIAFNNITVNGGLTFPGTMTVNGNLQINGGGFLNSSPIYGSSSTLVYNTSYNIFNEWVNGSSGAGVPQNVTIQNNSIVSFNGTATSRSILGNLTIASGSTLALSTTAGGDLNLAGNFANAGTFTHNSRSITFNGTGAQSVTAGASFAFVTVSNTGGTVTSTTTFTVANSLVINSGATLAIGNAGIVNNGTVFNVDGTLQINSGGFIQNASPAPVYGSSSTLVYNTGGAYGRFNEWTATGVGTIGVTGGYPNNVTISGSTLDIVNGSTVARAMAGNLLVSSGSFNLNAINSIVTIGGNLTTSGTGAVNIGTTTARLDVAGNVSNGGSLTLSTNVGGDLYVGGNLSNSGTFTHNSRSVYFTGVSQTVSGTFTGTGATNGFAYIRINNGSNVILGANINISNNITFNSGKLTLGTNNVTLSSGATITGASANNYFQTNSTGQLKQVVTTSPVSFPVGNSAYDPITLTNTGTSDIYGVYLVDGAVPDAVDPTKTVNRRWVVSESVAGGSALTAAVLQYNSGEEGVNFNSGSSTYVGFYNGIGWYSNAGTIAGSNPFTATMTGAALYPTTIPSNSYFTIAKDQALGSSVYDYYRSVTSGNWSAPATWQSSPDNSNWYSATTVPGAVAGGGVTTIQSGHTVTLDYSANPASLSIASGATVSATDNTKTLKIGATGTGALDITGTLTLQNASASATPWLTAGTATIYNGGVFTNSVGNAAEVSISTFNINNGGTYNHDAVGSSTTGSASDIPGSTRSFGASSNEVITKWATGSLLNSLPTLSYGNLTINVSTLGGSWNQVGNITNIQGDLNIISTGGGTREFRLVSSNGGSPLALSIGGNLNVSGGTLSLIGSSTSGTNTSTVTVAGNVTVSGSGILDFNSSAAAAASTLSVAGGLTVSGSGKITRGAGATSTLIFNKATGTQNVTLTSAGINTDPINFQVGTGSSTNTVALNSNFPMNSGATMTVKDNATLQTATYVVSGGTFTMGSSTSNTLRIGSTSGITASAALGNIQTTTRNYSFGNYIYNGASSQLTGDGLPSTINSLTIANTGASGSNIVVLSNSSTALTSGAAGALTLTSGYLSVGSNKTININSGGSVAGSGGDFDNTTSPNSGTIAFLGSGSVTGTVNFYPAVVQNGGMNYSVTSDIRNTITLDAGSFMTAAPVYGTGSTLIYNTGGTYNRNVEFGSLTGAGYPYNVTIQNGTTLDLSANGFADRAIAGDLVIGSGSAGTLSMGAMTNKLTINGNASIGTASVAGTLTLSSAAGGNIEVGGNWTRTSNGTFTPNSRTVSFIGATNASVTASGGASFNNMTINKTVGSTLSLNNVATVSNALTFTSGLAVLGSNDLTAGSISGGSATSYAIVGSSGTLKATFSGTQLMPVGYDATAYSPVTITNANSMQWSVRLEPDFTNYPSMNQSNALQRLWFITPSTTPTASATTLVFEYPDVLWTTPAQVNVYNYEAPYGWTNTLNGMGVTPVLANGMQTVTLTGQTTFSPFAITGTTTPLPVTLLRFSGRRENNKNVLKWTTATEINNQGFEVQRSTTGGDYTTIGIVASQATGGNSQSDQNYTFTDGTSITKAYYRLKQTDIDGHVKYSGIVLISASKDGSLTISGVYPNPTHSIVNMNVTVAQAQNLTLVITDISGRQVKSLNLIVNAGANSLSLDLSNLPSGTYFIQTKTAMGEESNAAKLIKQ